MGWFWAEDQPHNAPVTPSRAPPPECPMHDKTLPPSSNTRKFPFQRSTNPSEACPYKTPTATTPSTTQTSSSSSTIAALNPLNYMPSNLSSTPEFSSQSKPLPYTRETSSIPRGGSLPDSEPDAANDATSTNWVYPSPQQMYNAMLRKGHLDTPADAVESMVAVHNFLNEGAWAEILEWERRFGRGLAHGWRASAWGEAGSLTGAMIDGAGGQEEEEQPRLLRFMGHKDAMTPKATMLQVLGWLYPSRYASDPPFDRHDWFVERRVAGAKGAAGAKPATTAQRTTPSTEVQTKQIRYIIDYYSGAPEPTGEPVFYLDIRPAVDGPEAAAARLIRWGRDVWWRASGGKVRLRGGG